MYRPGFKAEGLRLARHLRIRGATPLNGSKKSDLKGAHVVVVVGRLYPVSAAVSAAALDLRSRQVEETASTPAGPYVSRP